MLQGSFIKFRLSLIVSALCAVLAISEVAAQVQPAAPAQAFSDPASWLGSTLEQAFGNLGVPNKVQVARGTEDWQDDVVFVYKDLELYWFKDRVWQVRVQAAYGIQRGDTVEKVTAQLGEPLHKRDELLVYQLSGRAWPIRLRVGLDETGRLLDLFIYRSDY